MAKKPAYEFKNLTPIQQNCLTLIESLGIYELRALARIFGDNSPTVLKRDDHIVIVMNKIISGEDLKPIPLRQGRPYKELSNIEGILAELSQITGKDYTLKTNQQRSATFQQKAVTFRQIEQDVYSQKLYPIEVRGVICEKSEKDFFFTNLDNGKSVLVKKDLDPRIKLHDYITGTAVLMNNNGEYILEEIKSLNYQNYASYKELSNPYTDALPSQTLEIAGKNVLLGSRYLLNTGKLLEKENEIKNLNKTLRENKIVSIAIIPNVMYEDTISIQNLGFNNTFMLKYDERPFAAYEAMLNLINHVESLQKQGLKVAIFMEDPTTIANSIDFAFKNNTKALMGHTEAAVDTIKRVVLLAKAGDENKHTTLFTTLDAADMFDQMYVSSVYKVSKKIEL